MGSREGASRAWEGAPNDHGSRVQEHSRERYAPNSGREGAKRARSALPRALPGCSRSERSSEVGEPPRRRLLVTLLGTN
jgi:hypothetical protein